MKAHAAKPAPKSARRETAPVTAAPVPLAATDRLAPKKASCACGGGCPRCQGASNVAKLPVSRPGDTSEREADAMADIALRSPALSRPPPKNFSSIRARDAPAPLRANLSEGHPLPPMLRSDMETRFNTDLGSVRLHAGARARRSARELGAAAYTVGRDVVFGEGQNDFSSVRGRSLLAHELAHVVQQSQSGELMLQRQCLTGAASCPPQICGDPAQYDSGATVTEAPGRSARGAEVLANPGAVTASGHGREATHIRDLAVADGITLSGVHGIFVDLDMASGAWTGLCRNFVGWVPPYAGPHSAECIFVPDSVERGAEAYLALSTSARRPHAAWLRDTLNTIRHEVQHLVHDRSTHAALPGATCSRSTVVFTSSTGQTYTVNYYLSELSAILSEFPLIFDHVRRRTPAGDYSQLLHNLQDAWRDNVFNCEESIRGVITALKCRCPCSDVDAYVNETLTFTAAGSTATATIPGMPAWTSTTRGVFVDLMRSMFPTVGWP